MIIYEHNKVLGERMNNNTIVFTDLDDTIFSTIRKQDSKNTECFKVGSIDSHGNPSGYLNPVQQAFYEHLKTMGKIMPVTARTTDALGRATLFDKDVDAIWYHGAIIRYQGVIDDIWYNRSVKILKNATKAFENMIKSLKERDVNNYFKISCSTYDDLEGLPLQVLVRSHDKSNLDETQVANLLCGLDMNDLYCHMQRSYITFLPKGVSKREAVKYLIEKENFDMTIGCGDSDVDLDFMSLCDYAVIPKKSFLFKNLNEEK